MNSCSKIETNIAIKTNYGLTGVEAIEKAVGNSINKFEIQFFSDTLKAPVAIKEACDDLMEMAESKGFEVNEIIIHPAIVFSFLEDYLIGAKDNLYKMIDDCNYVADKYHINMNLLFHFRSNRASVEQVFAEPVKELATRVNPENVCILLENIIFIEEAFPANVIILAKLVDDARVKVCFDTTHAKARANIYEKDIEKYFADYIGAGNSKYVKQIHFAEAINNDGYKEKNTHGRCHENYIALKKDVDILTKIGLSNCLFVAEVTEDNYQIRQDQTQEIKWLKRALSMPHEVEQQNVV